MRLRFGGKSYDVIAAEGPGGTLQVTVDGVRHEGRVDTHAFHFARQGDEVFLFWEGVAYRGTLEREGARPRERPSSGALEAPMPGKVIAVRVAPGDAVRKGDELLVVEAM